MSKSDHQANESVVLELAQRALALLPTTQQVDWAETAAAVWLPGRWRGQLHSAASIATTGLGDLLHIDRQKQQLVDNTRQFVAGFPANNALLWGARGTGKSSLISALVQEFFGHGLRVVEVGKDALGDLNTVVQQLANQPYKFILFCDDLSFEATDPSYKVLKSALEGSIVAGAANVVIYATSNRRHLLPERMSDNQQARMVDEELHQSEATEEKVSLSDRFGLWLSFYPVKQEAYLDMATHWVMTLAKAFDAQDQSWASDLEEYRAAALRWALARGVRSGRTAQHFARHWVGQQLTRSTENQNN